MNLKAPLALLAALPVLAACQSASQMEQSPPTWTALYQRPWEPMANCIVAGSQRPLVTVTPTFSSGRAQVVEKNAAGGVMGVFEIRQVQGGATEVSYRSVYGGPDTDAGGGARRTADRCARP
jgi:uncharacterized lipoprotein YajG